ncbi:Zinc finger, CCHC-type [Gossypium australe]|uniref:Zinc finger, CCHC-type n=1 Tax=Gossypium australe TaxID=47621 RepID=A0A5B6X621_9ROSI|nr:Zinc finger, CCHC-type [Gossypium australe]
MGISGSSSGNKPLNSKCIFKWKMKADGTIEKYKTRLVIKGYRQKEGLDYFDTFSPVSRISSIRMILANDALRNLEVHQMDVKTAFLNGDLDEEIYMILEKFSKDDSGIARTPIDTSQHLSKNRGESINRVEYARIIGSLMYPMSCTRPNIAFTDYGLHYSRDLTVLEGFSDASWISDIQDTKGTSGYVFTLEGGTVSSKSSRQMIITISTIESDSVALKKSGEEMASKFLRGYS